MTLLVLWEKVQHCLEREHLAEVTGMSTAISPVNTSLWHFARYTQGVRAHKKVKGKPLKLLMATPGRPLPWLWGMNELIGWEVSNYH